MTCTNCGSEIASNEKSCHNCGIVINSSKDFQNTQIIKATYFSNLISTLRKSKDVENNYSHSDGKYSNSNKKRKRIILYVAIFIILVASLSLLLFKDKIFYSSKGKRTVMIYMIGSDLESKYLAASRDIDEMTDSSIDYDDVNIIIYTGGTKNWHNEAIPNDKQALFLVKNGKLEKLIEFKSDSMLDYKNLVYLLDYGYNNFDTEYYKTDYYDLILWDHGAGPIYGYGYDEYHNTDSMSLIDIKKALDESPFNGVNKLELVGFDACLMSTVEVAHILSDYAEYMVASQEFEPGMGWDYSFLEKIDSNTSSIDLGKNIINSYYKFYSDKSYINGVSLSFLKLSKIFR